MSGENVNSKLDDALDRAFDIHDGAGSDEGDSPSPGADVSSAETDEEVLAVTSQTTTGEGETQGVSEPVEGRDERGRFAKKEVAAPVVEPQPVQPQVEQIAAPQFWKSEHKALWDGMPPEARKAVAYYEQLRNQWANDVGNKYAALQQKTAAFDKVLEPYIPKLKRQGLDAVKTVGKLLSWQEDLEAPDRDTRIRTANELISTMGLNPYDLLGHGGALPGQQQQYNPVDGVVEDLRSELSALREEIASKEREVHEQRLAGEYNGWATEVDQTGQPLRPMARFFEPQIAQAIPYLKQAVPGRSVREYLQAAYDAVLEQAGISNRGPVTPAPTKTLTPEQIQAAKKKTQAANAAASSVKSSPSDTGSMKAKAKNLDEALDMAFAQHL